MNNKIYEKAHEIMKKRRLKAVNDNELRISEINKKIPQINEVNDAIINTGKELINTIFNGNSDKSQEKLEQLKNYNLSAQAMTRKLLADNGYPEDYLDIHYQCPFCSDTGYFKNEFCECFQKLCVKLSADEMNKVSNLSLSGFDSFSLNYYKGSDLENMRKILEFSKNYAENFTIDSCSILMFGKTGLGKTHLSLAIANKILEKGYGVIYDSVINILRNIEREHFRDHSSEMIDLIMNADLLIIDDLGTEYETSFSNSTIYNIINTRLNTGKPTIVSTNLDFQGISRRYDQRIVSRFVSVYKCLEFTGEDVRLQKAANQ